MTGETEADSLGAAHSADSGDSGGTPTTGLTGLTETSGGTSDGATTDTQPGPVTTSAQPEGTTGETGETGDGSLNDESGSGDASGSTSAGSTTTDASADEVDLSGYQVVQTSSSRTFTIPDGTLVAPGTVIVIGRDASRGAFEQHWGALPGDVVYLDAEDGFPAVNGEETYTLRDPGGSAVDGPTPPLQSGDVLHRTDLSGGLSWTLMAEGNADPGLGLMEGASGVYLTEASDATGTGNFIYEYVELQAWP